MFRLLLLLGALMTGLSAFASDAQRVSIPAAHRDGVTLAGFLQRPQGAQTNPVPAAILLHGCSGPLTSKGVIRSRERVWMQRLADAGYASLLVDSFNPRNVQSTCGQPTPGVSAEEDRPYDAYAALAWLRSQPGIDDKRIALMGWSHGATAVLAAVSRSFEERCGFDASQFDAAIAFYPGCLRLTRTEYRTRVPLFLQLGAADDWTRARYCERLARMAESGGAGVKTWIYANAHHGFDSPSGSVQERRLPSGRVVHSGPEPAARELAIARTMEALGAAVGRDGESVRRLGHCREQAQRLGKHATAPLSC